jgi:hypothetical protein
MPSKSVGGRKLAGGFDSRPPPLLEVRSDQRRSGAGREGRAGEGPRSEPERPRPPHKFSVLPPPGAGQVFRRPAGGPDKSSAAVLSKERRKRHSPPR